MSVRPITNNATPAKIESSFEDVQNNRIATQKNEPQTTAQNNRALQSVANNFAPDDDADKKDLFAAEIKRINQENLSNVMSKGVRVEFPKPAAEMNYDDYVNSYIKAMFREQGVNPTDDEVTKFQNNLRRIGAGDGFGTEDKTEQVKMTERYRASQTSNKGETIWGTSPRGRALVMAGISETLRQRQTDAIKSSNLNEVAATEEKKIAVDLGGIIYESGRKIVEAIINIPQDTVNAVFFPQKGKPSEISAGRAKIGEQFDEIWNAKRIDEDKPLLPRIETDAAKYDFQSEAMRRNIKGEVDGDGIKTGDAVSTGTSIIAPLVVGKVASGKSPQTLKTSGALSKVEASTSTAISSNPPRKVSTGGLRNEMPLTEAQKAEALSYAKSLGIAEADVVFSENMNTSYKLLFGQDRLYIGTDVLPSSAKSGLSANSRISLKGAIAHELEGHRVAELAGKTNQSELLEEVQASIRAARFAPKLTTTERVTLIRDALERLQKNGLKIREVKKQLWITKQN